MARPLDAQEDALARLLARAGLPTPASRAFAALARGGGHTSTDLAAATGLARQEAGDAANELVRLGLARVDKVPTGGRPMNRYHRAGDGLAAFLRARRDALRDELNALDELEARFSG